ncbi:MAG: cadherin repeat domain-containing protein, partial [Oceanospirillaceae bacterium]|nr:cadherin repeat domain-containing protein [Oceanospirillaceae bacterium]
SGAYNLDNSTVYWGVWDDAYSTNSITYDNVQFMTEVRQADDAVAMPTTGTLHYKDIAKSKVYSDTYKNTDGSYNTGTLNDAQASINFSDNTGEAVYNITFAGLTQAHKDALTLSANKYFYTQGASNVNTEGLMMGTDGSNIGIGYRILHNGHYAKGSVLLGKDEDDSGMLVHKIPTNAKDGTVAKIVVEGMDSNANVTYSISGSDRFAINDQGEIYLTGASDGTGLNPTKEGSKVELYDLVVTATDGTNTKSRHVYVEQLDITQETSLDANTLLSGSKTANFGTYLNTRFQPTLDAGIGVTNLNHPTSANYDYRPGGSDGFDTNKILESGAYNLDNSTVYWGVWDDAYSTNSITYDNVQFMTEVRQ